jgi:heme A synthase
VQNQPPLRVPDAFGNERRNGHHAVAVLDRESAAPRSIDTSVPVHAAFRWVSYATVVSTYLLIVLGAFVRASGSGLGCPDWPLCYGQPVPPGHAPGIIEYSHRVFGAFTSLLIVSTVVLWIRAWGARRLTVGGGALIGTLLATQIGLGALVVKLELPPFMVMVHLGMAMLLLALLIGIAALASPAPRRDWIEAVPGDRFLRMVIGAVASVYLLILLGALVRASGASWACAGFPLCNGELLPFGENRLTDLHLTHRLFAYLVAIHLAMTVARAVRHERGVPAVPRAAWLVAAGAVAQILVGITAVSTNVPPATQVLHVAGAGAVWASTIILLTTTLRARHLAAAR